MNRNLASAISAALLVAGAAWSSEEPAAAEGEHGAEPEIHGVAEYPTELIKRPLELPSGILQLNAGLDINLSKSITNAAGETVFGPFKPVRTPLSAFYGVGRNLQVGVETGGFCLNGMPVCDKLIDDVGFEAALGILHQKGLELSLQSGFFLRWPGETTDASLGLGIDVRLQQGQFAVRAGPKFVIGLNNRDGANREYLQVPIDFQYQVDPRLALDVGLALNLLVDPPGQARFGDDLGIPLRVGAIYALSRQFDVGAFFSFSNLLGKESFIFGPSGFDGRVLSVFVAFRPG